MEEKILKSSKYLIVTNPDQVVINLQINNEEYGFLSCMIYYGSDLIRSDIFVHD